MPGQDEKKTESGAEEEPDGFQDVLQRLQRRADAWKNLTPEERERLEAERKAEEEAAAAKERFQRVKAGLRLIPPRYHQANVDKLPDAVKAQVERLIIDLSLNPKGTQGLLLAGPTGTGKTFAMWAAIRLLILKDAGIDFEVHKLVSLLNRFRPGGGAEDGLMERLTSCDILFLDDLAVQKASDWVTERLYEIIDTRYDAMLPVMVTTNLQVAALKERVDERVVSRLYEMCEVLEGGGRDRRRV